MRRLDLLLKLLGIGAIVAGGFTAAAAIALTVLFAGPIIFWIAWNLLRFGPALGLPKLGLGGIILAAAFLAIGFGGKIVITAIVFLVDPRWFHAAAHVHWPAPTLRNFVAVCLLSLLAARPY